MDLAFIEQLSENSDYVQDLSPNFWLMDDHRWAFYVWEKARIKNPGPYSLVHLDFHYDGVNDFQDCSHRDDLAAAVTEEEIFQMVKEKDHIQYDSFIAPAIIRGLIKEVHYFCLQSEDDTNPGIDTDILEEARCEQFFYKTLEELVKTVKNRPVLFDLCLDLFNKNDDKTYEGTLWPDCEILDALDICQPLLALASVVTVSLSFGYSGTAEQTKHLAKIVIPRCITHMNA